MNQDPFKVIYKDRELFKTVQYHYDDVRDWLHQAVEDRLFQFGASELLSEYSLEKIDEVISQCQTEDGYFDFFKLIFGNDDYDFDMQWAWSMTWFQAIPLQWLQRNWFEGELYWKQDENCAGYEVDDNPDCNLRPKELMLLNYTPRECLDGGEIPGCDRLIAYTRLSQKGIIIEQAQLQFLTTIFTCIILGAGAIMFANDTQYLIILPITKMVGIIKTLADDPLQKPDPPNYEEEESISTQKGQMKTIELQKTIFRIGNLL